MQSLKEGFDLGITPDGPKGPRHKLNNGAIILAKKYKKKIIIMKYISNNFWQLNSWDKFIIPKPFSKIDFYASEPIDISNLNFEESKLLLENLLNN